MNNTNLKQLTAGDVVTITSKQANFVNAVFLGFSDNDQQYSHAPVFADWSAVKTAKHVSTFKALEALNDSMPYGYSVYALFLCQNSHNSNRVFIMRTFLFEGRWSLGSGAEAMTITRVPTRVAPRTRI